jgi:hypothetical protein
MFRLIEICLCKQALGEVNLFARRGTSAANRPKGEGKVQKAARGVEQARMCAHTRGRPCEAIVESSLRRFRDGGGGLCRERSDIARILNG